MVEDGLAGDIKGVDSAQFTHQQKEQHRSLP